MSVYNMFFTYLVFTVSEPFYVDLKHIFTNGEIRFFAVSL